MKAYANKKKHTFFDRHPVVSYVLLIIGAIIFMFLELYPSLQPLRDSTAYNIVSKILFSGVIIFFTWFAKNKPVKFEKISLTVFATLPWLSLIIKSHRVIMLLQIVLFLLLLGACIKHFLSDKKYSIITIVVTIILGMLIVSMASDYTFLYNPNGIHFWQIGLSASIITTTVFTVLLIKKKIVLEDNRTSEKTAAPFLIFAMSFILVSFLIYNLNYALDFSEPVEFRTTISEKELVTHSRSSSDYIFIADVQGKEREFNVDSSEYYSKEVGDSFSVELYSGAFSHEYYIYKYSK